MRTLRTQALLVAGFAALLVFAAPTGDARALTASANPILYGGTTNISVNQTSFGVQCWFYYGSSGTPRVPVTETVTYDDGKGGTYQQTSQVIRYGAVSPTNPQRMWTTPALTTTTTYRTMAPNPWNYAPFDHHCLNNAGSFLVAEAGSPLTITVCPNGYSISGGVCTPPDLCATKMVAASNGHVLPTGGPYGLNRHGYNRCYTNNTGANLFVPSATAAELESFITYKPASVTMFTNN